MGQKANIKKLNKVLLQVKKFFGTMKELTDEELQHLTVEAGRKHMAAIRIIQIGIHYIRIFGDPFESGPFVESSVISFEDDFLQWAGTLITIAFLDQRRNHDT